jgi:hypothetical protein
MVSKMKFDVNVPRIIIIPKKFSVVAKSFNLSYGIGIIPCGSCKQMAVKSITI